MTQVATTNDAMPRPTRRTAMEEADELRPVRARSPMPDLLPRTVEDLAMMRTFQREAEQGRRYVAPRRDLPPPYKNDDECDEFEDQTIDTTVANLPPKACVELKDGQKDASTAFAYKLGGPSAEGEVRPVFSCGHLFKIACPDGAVCFYNDSDKYEMHVKLTFLALSSVELNDRADIYVISNKEFSASRVVYPGETTELIRAKAGKFRLCAKAVPLNDEQRDALYGEVNDHVADELSVIAAAIGVRDQQLDEEKVLTYCESQGHPYVDADFRPCDYSLYRPDLDLYLPRFLPWHRPSTWIPASQQKEVRIFRRDVHPSQVTQGSIGDAYLVSALALLAERKMLLQDLFRHPVSAVNGKAERALGAYWITLNFNGWWLPILLDDFLPSTRDGPEYAVCGTDLRRLWVPLLEKAYAKVHGSYANIASGDALEPLTEFTGFPISRFDRMWSEAREDGSTALFDEMQSYHKHKYLQLLCTPSNGADSLSNAQPATSAPTSEMEANYQAKGLKLHHGYSVVDVQSFEDLDLRLLRLRNPWGTGGEWDGAWSKTDRRWSKFTAVKDACYAAGGEPSDLDGTFWMEWQTALQMFCGGGCCHIREPWYDYRIRGEFDRALPSVVLEIHVSHPTEAFLTLAQEDERDGPSLEYDAILLTVYRQDGRKARLEATSTSLVEKPDTRLQFNFSREVALRYTFRPEHSPYYVIPRIHNAAVTKPYILGLLPDTYVGNGIAVEFKKMTRECKALQNLPSFIPSTTMSDTAAEYQVRSVRQPMDCVGTELKDERLREFGLAE